MKIYFAGNLNLERERGLKRLIFGKGKGICRLASYFYLEWFEIIKQILFKKEE